MFIPLKHKNSNDGLDCMCEIIWQQTKYGDLKKNKAIVMPWNDVDEA